MMRSLYLRLGAVLLSLFILLAAVFLLALSQLSGSYLDEQAQQTQSTVADYIAREHRTIGADVLDVSTMATLFSYVAIVNPVAQAYLLDNNGVIVAQSSMPTTLRRDRIDLAPVHAFLSHSRPLPIKGDDPREVARQRIFSVAPIKARDKVIGYVYVTLAGANPLSFDELWMGSQKLKFASAFVLVSVVFAFLTGMLLFRYLTNRLRILTRKVEDFKERQYTMQLHALPQSGRGDEIDILSAVFADMADKIMEQFERIDRDDRERRSSITNASHDLRTPLTALQGFLETLLIKAEVLNPAQRQRYIEIAYKHSTRLQVLVGEMFDLARFDAPELTTQRELFALDELVVDITHKFQLAVDAKAIALVAQFARHEHFVLADLAMIERVFENLLGNAIRHTAHGGRIEISLALAETTVGVTVRDNGEGISDDLAPQVFDRFVTGNKRDGARSGLGLAIVKRIIELHGGVVSLESAPGVGTAIHFTLPRGSSR